MFTIKTTKQFDKEVKLCIKRGYDISKLKEAMHILAETGTLPSKYKPHKLSGNYDNCLGMPHKRRLAFNLATKRH